MNMNKETKGSIVILMACISFAFVAVLVKIMANTYSGAFMATVRYVVGLTAGLILLKALNIPVRVIGMKNWVLRGVFGFFATLAFFVSIQMTSSGRATLLMNTYPAFVALYGYLFFKEKIYLRNIASLILCFIGAAFIFYDGSIYSIKGDLLALLCGALAGFAIHYMKKCREHNNPMIIYMATCIFGMSISPFTYKEAFSSGYTALLIVVFIGFLSFLGQMGLTYGYKYVPATKGSILSYASIPVTLLLSLLIGEQFKTRFFIGIILVFAGILVNYVRINFVFQKKFQLGVLSKT